jgi:preprotein translocase subunit SecA
MDINNFLSKLFGNKSTRDMKEIQPIVEEIKAAYPEIEQLTNDELRAKDSGNQEACTGISTRLACPNR